MSTTALALALAAAAVHAGWNVALAGREDTQAANAVATATAALLFAPVVVVGHVTAAAWPFIVVSAALELAYFALLGRAYARAELSVVYPIARGLAPVAVLLFTLATATAGEAVGVVLVAVGILLVRGVQRVRGVGLGLVLALAIAGYTVVDKHGLAHATALPYFELVLLLAAPPYVAVVAVQAGTQRLRAAAKPSTALLGIAMFTSYLLVLEALRRAPAAPVSAVRESSVVIAVALAAFVLREQVGRRRALGAVLVAAGVAVVAVA
jgi:uncharacterized membrane protein